MNIKSDILWRVYVLFAIVSLAALAVVFQAFRIQTTQGDYWKSQADSLTISMESIEAERGNVYTEGGHLLATSVPSFDVYMDFKADGLTNEVFNDNISGLATSYSNYFKYSTPDGVKKEFEKARKKGNRYYRIQKNLSYNQVLDIKEFPIWNRGKYKGGLILLQNQKRQYPYGGLAHRTIGYVRADDNYSVGIERTFNQALTGKEGQRVVQRISGGYKIPISDGDVADARDGLDIITTLDINLQDVAHQSLLKTLNKNKADHGCVIVMEVATGKIKAISNLGLIGEKRYGEKYNYAVGESVEPGSTMKLASMMALIEDGYITLDDSVNLEEGLWKYSSRRTIRDATWHPYHWVSAKTAFVRSSNVGVVKLVHKHYKKKPEKFVKRLKQFHVHEKTGIAIAGEGSPLVKTNTKDVNNWTNQTLLSMAFGYEMQMTPLQQLNLYNAVANNGKLMQPYLVSEIRDANKAIETFSPTVIDDKICSDKTLSAAREMLEAVVSDETHGTAKNLIDKDYTAAGKTGTAHKFGSNGYEDKYRSSFVGYFPADNPIYSCIVVVDNPTSGQYYGSSVAGPVFKEIADKFYASSLEMHTAVNIADSNSSGLADSWEIGYSDDMHTIYKALGLQISDQNLTGDWSAAYQKGMQVELKPRSVVKNTIPNVKGMGLRDALFVLENQGLKVEFSGHGKIVSQNIAPGEPLANYKTIKLQLK